MNKFERYFFEPVSGVRPYLLQRALLGLLAFDCWLDLVPHGARYGAGGFNVAHFAILDVILPTPTPSMYVGMLLFVGFASLTMALTRPTRFGMIVLTSVYTWGWMMSMLDSYQHHYLISLLLLMMCFMPYRTASELYGKPGEGVFSALGDGVLSIALGYLAWATLAESGTRGQVMAGVGMVFLFGVARSVFRSRDDARHAPLMRAWAYPLFCVSCGLVYFFTAITKMNADWRDGHALRRISGHQEGTREFVAWCGENLGLTPDEFWWWFAKTAIAGQLVIAASFMLLATQDRWKSWKLRRVLPFLIAGPLLFHAGAEQMDLKIGWFSDYMIMIVCIVFMPEEWLDRVARGASLLGRGLDQGPLSEFIGAGRATVLGGAIAGAGVGALLVYQADLPGALGAAVAGGAFVVVNAAVALRRSEDGLRTVAASAIMAPLAALLLYLALGESDARWDYYRFAGGDHRRRATEEQPELFLSALHNYEQAQRYLPEDHEGRDRSRELGEMRQAVQRLRARGVLPPPDAD